MSNYTAEEVPWSKLRWRRQRFRRRSCPWIRRPPRRRTRYSESKNDPCFSDIEWDKLENGKIQSPLILDRVKF